MSDDLTYDEHTVKIQGKNNKPIKLYKLIFWPKLNAKRMNITELDRKGTWLFESDLVGGVRGYAQNDATTDTATASIHFSRLWVYGTVCEWHRTFDLDINSFNAKIDPYDPKLNTDDLRKDSVLLYESPEFSPSNGLKFTIAQTATINYIYYIEEPSPSPTPSVLPISIRSAKMTRTGDVNCDSNNCPSINGNVNNYHPDADNTYQCGETCTATTGSFEYNFIGVKFGIFSHYSIENGKYDVLLDGKKVTEVDLGKQGTSKYILSYISEDLQYREHTVKIQGKGNKQIQLYKLIFWPSLNAKRMNITEFTRDGTWKYETDLIGGVRAYTEIEGGQTTSDNATAQIRFSKFWIYGTKCDWHGKFNVEYGNVFAEMSENGPYDDNTRQDSALLFESPLVISNRYTLKLWSLESVTFNYIYYVEDLPAPTPSAIPISIRSAKMTRTGDVKCGSNNCPNINGNVNNYHPDAEDTYQCGETCTATTGSFEYSFTGVKFGIFGVLSNNNGAFDISIDGQKVHEVDTGRTPNEKYSLLYVSEDLKYHQHTVKIQGKGNKQIQLYKLVYWPSLNAKKMNITEFNRTGTWKDETDLIGGVRSYTEIDQATSDNATTQIRFSKLWIYGTMCNWHGTFKIEYGDLTADRSEKGPYNDDTRLDSHLLFESPEISPTDFKLKIYSFESVTLNFIYYVEDQPTPTPSVIPISIPMENFAKSGLIKYYTDNTCPTTNLDSPSTYNCAKKMITSSGTFTYTFTGEKFGIIGAYSPTNGKFTLEIDSNRHEIDTYKDKFEEFAMLYFSDNLQYKSHTIKISGNGQQIQLYKLIYWPSLRAKRLNITEFDLQGEWKSESDLIGGIRSYTAEGGVNETATATVHCSHFWIYGSRCGWHGKIHLSYGNINEVIDEKITTSREDYVLLYESPDFSTDASEMKFISMDTATLNYVYYIEVPQNPTPTPSAIPLSIKLDQMNQNGDFVCYDNKCETTDLNSPSSYQCGTKCSSNSGTYNYTFTGEKFAIIGATGSNYDSFNLLLDNQAQPTTINVNSPNTNEFAVLYLSDDLSFSEHVVKIQGNNGLFKLYKLVYWPTLNARRINISNFELKGDWQSESDLIGGIRSYTTVGGVNETATATIHCSHLWVYGTKCSWHGNLYINIGDYVHEDEINSKVSDPFPKRYDAVMMYESQNLNFENHKVSFVIADTATLYCLYYLEMPPPSSTPTPSYTPEPTPYGITYTEENCTNSDHKHRCYHNNNEKKSYDITIVITKFSKLNNNVEKDGGAAIHLINTGIFIDSTTFDECKSEDNYGGAIYLENNYLYEVNYDLNNLAFDNCRAKIGGAVYIYCVSERSTININKCTFNDNVALASKDEEYFGGSAVFLTCINAHLTENAFNANKGEGGALKLYEKFNDPDTGSFLLSGFEYRTIFVSKCTFEIEDKSDCSLFYFGGRKDVKVVLSDSTFNGKLDVDSHHISGFMSSNDATKLNVENCRFSHDFLKSIKIDKMNDYISINLKNQVFEYQNIKTNKNYNQVNNTWKFSYLALAAIVVAGIIFTLKKRNSNELDNTNNDPLSLTDSN